MATSQDIRDMLDLPVEARRPTKKPRVAGQKNILKGLAREVQNLSGDNPIAIVPETSAFKKRRFGNRKPAAKWESKPFKNTARDDQSLILYHWKRKVEIPAALTENDSHSKVDFEFEDSAFAKFNVRLNLPKYDDSQYNSSLQSSDWTKEETDYLMNLVEEYSLRWPIIWDRYEYQKCSNVTSEADKKTVTTTSDARSMEDLKERYYKVSAAIIQASASKTQLTPHESCLLEAMQKYDKQQEISRKKFADALFHRTPEEAKEEENLLIELKRILARSERLGCERQELYSRLDAPTTKIPIGAYTTSQGLQQLLSSLVQADKIKRGKSLNGSGANPTTQNHSTTQSSCIEARRDSNVREQNTGSSAGNKKSTQIPSERRQLTSEEEVLFGVRHFDRITSTGPAFRHDKIMKQMINKSSVQQAKISNILSELRIPPRLLMPTYRIGEIFESLQHDIAVLLDLKKLADKLQGEISLLKTLKEEREKAKILDNTELQQEDKSAEVTAEATETAAVESKLELEEVGKEKSPAPDSGTHKRSASLNSNQSTKRRKR